MKRIHINSKKINNLPKIGVFLFGLISGISYNEFEKREWLSTPSANSQINICFTPPAGCSGLIVREIMQAKKSVYVHAYSFTSNEIANALIESKKKGLKVSILYDRSQLEEKNSKITELIHAGVEVAPDIVSGLAHNKVIIIDEEKVITGSYNFTRAADKRNADNVVLIKDREIASFYKDNWFKRKNRSLERTN